MVEVISVHILTQRNPIGGGFAIQPEGHPRQDDEKGARSVNLYEKVAHVPLKMERNEEHTVLRCETMYRSVSYR